MGSRWLWGFIVLAIISLLASLFGPWSAKARSAQMGTSIQNALNAAGYNFVDVEMNGNVASLSGEAGSDADMSSAFNLAANTECETCKKKGKIWHVVENNMSVKAAPTLPTVSPYVFNAVKGDDGNVVVSGYVGSENERQRILVEADTLFNGNVTDDKVELALGAPADGWGDVLSRSLGNLALLDRGSLTVNDTQTLLRGFTTDADIRDRINSSVSNMTDGYIGAANITVDGASAVNVGEVTSEGICQSLFDSLKGQSKINFAVNKAEIQGAPSFDLLNTLASAANQCSSFRIAIGGHTDSDGDDAYNQWLSEARANTVVAYLADSGVERDRLSGTGYGEAQPVASNDTPEGKAANRRIEFLVTTSE